jgi:poly-beta-hydroxyalkanoate depolymerase
VGGERPGGRRDRAALPFGSLLRFRKDDPSCHQPRVLLAAPLSGHFATLLRETVRTLLQDHEVYITDWHNARDVSLRHGASGWTTTSSYMIRLHRGRGRRCHMVAVCQPCVAALAATAVMAEDDHPATPAQPHADGRPGGLPRQPDRGQPAGHQQADRLVREEPHQPPCRCRTPVSCAACTRASCSCRPS